MIEYQGEKQIKPIKDNKKERDNLDNKKQLGNNELLVSKERQMFATKDSIKQMNYLKKIDYGDLKLIVSSSGLETNFGELKDPVAFLDSITKR